MALFLLSFALLLPRRDDWRDAIPLGVIAAGAVYVYSFPGLFWLAGAAVVWWRASSSVRRATRSAVQAVRPARDSAALAAAVALGVLVRARSLPEIGRLIDFADFRALHPDRANEGGLGNLRQPALAARGAGDLADERLPALGRGRRACRRPLFYLGGACRRSSRWPSACRAGFAATAPRVPAALLAAAVIYLGALAFGTVYTCAKALAIAAPLITLIVLGGLLASAEALARCAVAARVRCARGGVALSSFLVLRQAPVAPEDHADQLAEHPPAGPGREAAVPRPRQLRPLRAARLEAVHRACATSTTPTTSSRTSACTDVCRSSTSTRSPRRRSPGSRSCSPRAPRTRAGRRPASSVRRDDRVLRALEAGARVADRPGAGGDRPGAGAPRRLPEDALPSRIVDLPAIRRSRCRRATGRRATIESGSAATIPLDLSRGAGRSRCSTTRPGRTSPARDRRVSRHPAGQPRLPRHGALLAGGRRSTCPTARRSGSSRVTVEQPPLAGRLLGANSVAHLGRSPLAPREPRRGRAARAGRGAIAVPGRELRRLRRLVHPLGRWTFKMDLGFGEALLIFGALLAVAAALSGLMRGTVLSVSVLSVALGHRPRRDRRGLGRRRRRRRSSS